MTEFFHYDDMTWDAVAALPRDTPLVLPLGWGYDFNALAGQLSHPAQVGLLPLFPFGWRRSWLDSARAMPTCLERRWARSRSRCSTK